MCLDHSIACLRVLFFEHIPLMMSATFNVALTIDCQNSLQASCLWCIMNAMQTDSVLIDYCKTINWTSQHRQ